MIINHNLSAMNAHRQLGANQANGAKSQEKLSSGLRINRAGDDAAGLAISEKMRAQVRGLDQASRNAQDGISLIQTAEGALAETHNILQRMRELATQSANDTNTDEDRSNIQDEIGQLTEEIDRIQSTTQFNTKNLIDGSRGGAVNTAVANVNTGAELKTAATDPLDPDVAIDTTTLLTDLKDSNGNDLGIKDGDKIELSYVKDGSTITETISVGAATDISGLEGTSNNFTLSIDATTNKLVATADGAGLQNSVNGLTFTVKDEDGNVRQAATNALSAFSETTAAKNVRQDGKLNLHIGANQGQNVSLEIQDMGSAALGVKGLKAETQTQADVAIKVLDGAIKKVSSERSNLGSMQNRLEHTISNLNNSSENMQAAESRIRDVDMAKEIMEFTKNNILSQASQSMLAQANQAPQQVLQLLG